MESHRPTGQDLGANKFWWKTCAFLLATVAIATLALFCWTKRRLWELARRLPGPTPLPLLGNVLTFAGCDLVQFFKIIVQFVEVYGSIFKIWMGPDLFVILSNPALLEKVLGNKHCISRTGYVTKLAKPYFRNGLLLSDGETWRVHRKIIMSTFHNNVLNQFVENFAKNSRILADKMGEKCVGAPFDVYPLLNLCTLDVICETAMGTVVNAQLDHDEEYVQAVVKSLHLLSERFQRPWLSVDWMFNLTRLGREQAKTLQYLHGNAHRVISEKLAAFHASGRQKTRVDDLESVRRRRKLSLLDLLIEDEQLTPEEIHDEAMTIVGAGSETTANTCCYVLFLLGVHQDIQQRVLEEQDSLFGQDAHRLVTCDDLPNMPYLEQVGGRVSTSEYVPQLCGGKWS
jgi:cytochrome P450 family 4